MGIITKLDGDGDPPYRFIKHLGTLDALLEQAEVPKAATIGVIIRKIGIPKSMLPMANKAFSEGKSNYHKSLDKDSYGDFAEAFLSIKEKMAREIGIWDKPLVPDIKKMRPADYWALRQSH